MTGGSLPLRYRAAQLFHRYFTTGRFLALLAFCTVLVFATTIPATVSSLNSRLENHRDLARSRGEDLAAFMDEQFIRMAGTVDVIHGFIASAAPLQVPNYFVDDAVTRANSALRTATPGALSNDSFARVNDLVRESFIGYSDLVVQPGLVNVFTNAGSSAAGDDWFTERFARTELMVNSSSDLVRLPTDPVNDSSSLVLRAVIFDNVKNISRDPDDLDPATGRHVNWNHLWGGLSVVMNLTVVAFSDDMASRAQPDRYHWMFKSEATTLSTFDYPDVVLRATDDQEKFRKRNAVRVCCQNRQLRSLCFSVMPRAKYWDGERVPETIAFLIAVDIVFALLCVGVPVGLLRLLVGSKPDPLKHAPTKTPLHAVCIDVPDANRMWSEVPFIMHELTTTFTSHLEATAEQHCVYVAIRLGCTAIAVTRSRPHALAFARAIAEWGHTFTWPPHIMVHCPRGTIKLTTILHTMENVTVRIDREQDQCDVTGPDIKALLLLRVAAVEQHVICTGEFLGLPSLNQAQRSMFAMQHETNPDGPASQSNGNPLSERTGSTMKTADILTLVGPVGELGVCQLPIPSVGPVTNIRGFLLTSHATDGRTVDEVLDTFPDEVWAEWKSARAFDEAGFDNLPSAVTARNPLRPAEAGDAPASLMPTPPSDRGSRGVDDTVSSGGSHQNTSSGTGPGVAASSSKTARMAIPSNRQAVTSAHLNNDSADKYLGGTAVDLFDVRRLAVALLPVVGRAAENGSFAGSKTTANTLPTVMTAHLQALLEERYGTFLAALSVSTYFLSAYRIVFAPLEPEVRQAMVTRICAAVGVAAEDYSLTLAVRCTRLSMRYIDRWSDAALAAKRASAASELPASSAAPDTRPRSRAQSVLL